MPARRQQPPGPYPIVACLTSQQGLDLRLRSLPGIQHTVGCDQRQGRLQAAVRYLQSRPLVYGLFRFPPRFIQHPPLHTAAWHTRPALMVVFRLRFSARCRV